MSVWERLFGPRREARSACKANDADCFPSPSSPEPLCHRGLLHGALRVRAPRVPLFMDHCGGNNDESAYERMVRQTRLLAGMPCMHKETREVPCVPHPGCLTCGAREIVRMLDAEAENHR